MKGLFTLIIMILLTNFALGQSQFSLIYQLAYQPQSFTTTADNFDQEFTPSLSHSINITFLRIWKSSGVRLTTGYVISDPNLKRNERGDLTIEDLKLRLFKVSGNYVFKKDFKRGKSILLEAGPAFLIPINESSSLFVNETGGIQRKVEIDQLYAYNGRPFVGFNTSFSYSFKFNQKSIRPGWGCELGLPLEVYWLTESEGRPSFLGALRIGVFYEF